MSNDRAFRAEQYYVRLLERANALGALNDPVIIDLVETLAVCPGDKQLIRLLQDALGPYQMQAAILPDPFRPYPGQDSGLSNGDLEVGTVHETHLSWQLPLESIPHILIAGPTGGGKSSALFGLLEQVRGRVPIIYVTVKATDARYLIDPPVFTQAFALEELVLSLFAPQAGETPANACRRVVELLCKVFGLQFSRALLTQACDELLSLYANYTKHTGTVTSFALSDLYALLAGVKSKYAEGALAAVEMLMNATGSVFECSAGQSIEFLLSRRSTLLDISLLHDERVARFFVDWLMESVRAWLRANGPNDGSVQLIFAIDDATRFLSVTAERDGLMPLSHRYLMAREEGLRIIAVTHCPHDLAPSVLSQCGIVMQVGSFMHGEDNEVIGKALGLPYQDWSVLQRIPHRSFVARENLDRYDRPFGGVVRTFSSQRLEVTNADRKNLMAPILKSLAWTPAVPLAKVRAALEPKATNATPARAPGALPSADAMRLAHDVLAYPWDFLSQRYARLGFSGRIAQRSKDELVDIGWIREHAVPMRGRAPKLLEPTPELAAALHASVPNWGKGRFLHAFICNCAVERWKCAGYSSIVREKFYGSKAVDVVGLNPAGDLEGVEAAISLTNVVDNLEKNFLVQPRFSLMTTICLSMSEVRQAARAITAAPGLAAFSARIRIEPIAHWL